jgi:hypothetical protein
MLNQSKNRVIIGILIFGLVLIALFYRGLYPSTNPSDANIQLEASNKVSVVSTDPSPLEGIVLLPTQRIVITLNHPLLNEPEFRHRFDPEVEHTVTLSADKKTVTLSPKTTWPIGNSYTLFISPLSKFEDEAKIDGDIIYHFKTIEYKGV